MMKPNDIAIVSGGVTAPLWMPELQLINEWIALIAGLLTVGYLCIKIWKLWRNR